MSLGLRGIMSDVMTPEVLQHCRAAKWAKKGKIKLVWRGVWECSGSFGEEVG